VYEKKLVLALVLGFIPFLYYYLVAPSVYAISPTGPSNTRMSDDTFWFILFIIVIVIVWKLTHRRGKRKGFPQSVKQKTLEKQHHKCANCKRLLDVVDYDHKNGNRSDNKQSNCLALCPNCHADKTRRTR
jgi:hypothetical protein